MALDPLADVGDLSARNITIPDAADADSLLAAASAAVRDAAGCSISQASSTVDLVCSDWWGLDLPAGPVTAVSSVTIEGSTVAESTLSGGRYSSGWRKVGDRLLFTRLFFVTPAVITVTYEHGLATVPADIVDLVCGVVAIAANAAGSGDYGLDGLRKSVRLGDFSESFSRPDGADSPSPMALPDGVRQRLRARFGTSVAVIRDCA